MMRLASRKGLALTAGVIFLCGAAAEGEIPLQEKAGAWTFGTHQLSVRFDPATGWPATFLLDGDAVISPCRTLPFDIQGDRSWASASNRPTAAGITRVDDSTVRSRSRLGDWQVDTFLQLMPERKAARRWFELTWQGPTPTKLRAFWGETGCFAFANTNGAYRVPYTFPPHRVGATDIRPGHRTWSSHDPHFVLADNGAGWTAFWAHDSSAPDADTGSAEIQEEEGSIRVRQHYHCHGYAKPGVPQKVGDLWTAFRRADLETTLHGLHDWFGWTGQRVCENRPAWVKRLILYSLHPGGTIGSNCHDWGGFSNATRILPSISDLGCNGVWLMPLEDASIYCPRDYYKLQPGIGTAADYHAFIAEARQLGLHVWQDCVPHGGNNTNERAKAHPEWLVQNEDGSTLHYWGFDFNWPTWCDYMRGVASHYMKTFGIDGFRIDAVGGSHVPNWNPAIPYARASLSQSQGGFAMQRAIRAAVKAANPDGADLAEVGEEIFGTTSDAVYDFGLCYSVLHTLPYKEPETFVPQLRRWFYEQQCASLPDAVRMRFVESHDCLRSTLLYGQAAEEATVALTAWIPGFPLVYQEMEDGHSEAFHRIFRIRRQAAELSYGSADYLGVQVPDSVFACLRKGRVPRPGEAEWCNDYAWDAAEAGREISTVALINFSGKPVSGTAVLPGNPFSGTARELVRGEKIAVRDGAFPFSLPPFGYAAVRLSTSTPPAPGHPTGQHPLSIDVKLCDRSGRPIPPPARVNVQGDRFTAELAGRKPEEAMLVATLPGAGSWFARTAEGTFESPILARHPRTEPYAGPIYYLPQGGDCLWDSTLHPFGFSEGTALAGGLAGTSAKGLTGFGADARVRLLAGNPTNRALQVAVTAPTAEGLTFTVRTLRAEEASAPAVETGDRRLTVTAGGWLFEEGSLRLRIGRNGALRGLWRQTAPDCWHKLAESADFYTDCGWDKKIHYSQNQDVETSVHFAKEPDGRLRLRFEGRLRGSERFEIMRQPVAFRTEYVLGGERGFDFSCAVRATALPANRAGYLALLVQLTTLDAATVTDSSGNTRREPRQAKKRYLVTTPSTLTAIGTDGRQGSCRLTIRGWIGGAPARVFLLGDQLHCAWIDGPADGFRAETWYGMDGRLEPAAR